MKIYFDESYDNEHHYLLYGALLVPDSSRLQQRVLGVRKERGYQGEIKYNRCRHPATLGTYERVVDAFMEDEAYFRCVVVAQQGFDYSVFGRPDEPLAIKQARAYTKFAEMLLAPNVESVRGGVFLADWMSRCSGDAFLERIGDRFNRPGGPCTFRHVGEVPSNRSEHQCLQVCDLLLGCVLNNLKPTKKLYKNAIRKYLCERLAVPSFLMSAWEHVPLSEARKPTTKFNVWYWQRKKPR